MTEGGTIRDEPDGFPRQGSAFSRQDLVPWKNTSVETSTVMNWLGYGPGIIQARRDAYRECCKIISASSSGKATWLITGSKAEGLSCFAESDRDNILFRNNIICLEDDVNVYTFSREITVLKSYSRMTYPGHCTLLVEKRGTPIPKIVCDALCDDGYGRELMCSDLFVHSCSQVDKDANEVRNDRAGPSIPGTIDGILHTDVVIALRYHCPNILSKWAARPRHWPPPEVVQKVVTLGALLTPVGFKGSEYQHVEWRVCFNAGEIELVNNLNDTQIKLYVLLKMVKNDVLNSLKKEVSSYTLKNIILWIAENNPQYLFDERSLLHWLHEGLDALRSALVSRELPYYMIPDRNLMATCGLDEKQQRTWISTITEMMNEGPRMMLRLPKIRQALIAHPEPFRWYSRRRTELELLQLMFMNRDNICRNDNWEHDYTDVILQALKRRVDQIVKEVGLRMIMEGSRVINMQEICHRLLM